MTTRKTELTFPELLPLFEEYSRIACSGLTPGADAFLTAYLHHKKGPLLYIAATDKEAQRICDELEDMLPDSPLYFPTAYTIPYTMRPIFGPTQERRLSTLQNLLRQPKKCVITSASALFEPVPPPKTLFHETISLHCGDELDLEDIERWLTEIGFRREVTVNEPGHFSRRGGLMDIYPMGEEHPLRLEFWGDTLDSIREFDIFTQKSVRARSNLEILPMGEETIHDEQRIDALEKLEQYTEKAGLPASLYERIEHEWTNRPHKNGMHWFRHWFSLGEGCLLDYLHKDTCIINDDYLSISDRYSRIKTNYTNHMGRVPDLFRPCISSPEHLLVSPDKIEKKVAPHPHLFLKVYSCAETRHHYDFVPLAGLAGQLELLKQDMQRKQEEGYDIVLCTETTGHKQRLTELIGSEWEEAIQVRYLQKGFSSQNKKIVYYTDLELFNRTVQKKRRGLSKHTAPLLRYDSLSPGDVVVHIDHGIALFRGITTIEAAGHSTDCMLLEFQKKARIHVPIRDFHKVQKYIGSKESAPPSLSVLGGSGWKRKKERTRKNIQEMAGKLIRIYAEREYAEGLALPPDSSWQQEFEESFLYTPTPDQEKTMIQIKKDLQSSRPMDRLVCGDVGFGKTEVAMRAAFKAVIAGYQVAVLAPTTVLATQHGKTFRERMAEFPVRIATLSRLTSQGTTGKTLADISNGSINIIVGTHKILSSSVRYKNLGLVIIDEEQRFGVRQKERFTALKSSINMLSMSATPIPRTVHMSMAGIRDLSLITTPPQNRLPVETTVAESNDELLASAIQDELERGGQVFVVHNKIQELHELQRRVQSLVPEASIGIGHGQMDGETLEEIMTRFTHGEIDILVSTTIIENGIDIPNANTVIVEDANTMGLSQLYQIRGRVGRSDTQGYAYFFVHDFAAIKEESVQRLKALEQYTDLGSGFQLAMRDLELRGAGNLLGTDQSGTIAAVGFELYCELLKEEIERLRDRGNTEVLPAETEIHLGLHGQFPASYIREGSLRIQLYQRCTSCKTLGELRAFEREISDRFGALPEEVMHLILTMEIKLRAMRFFISKITLEEETLTLCVSSKDAQAVQKTISLFSQSSSAQFSIRAVDTAMELVTKIPSGTPLENGETVRAILKKCLYEASSS
ncbi:transcription-repair coupling factor [Chitinivibrio alkaliphilus]|uniref:Transcription-repair-coupling factor n=1 Tax=Chitinivibrio alkaliphilus ACht1 TaxID=1313304 RepID=U7D8H1_9BACT|nr:transcription-repair coupling factor [Chitinivibrio alkaliphilus]ERP39260.1 transcription-repair coupling factor [Chitinivibrio alkaliphilus ACht1]